MGGTKGKVRAKPTSKRKDEVHTQVRAPKGAPLPKPYNDRSGVQRVDAKGRKGWRLRFTGEVDNSRIDGTFYGTYEQAVIELNRRVLNASHGELGPASNRRITLYAYARTWADAYRWKSPGEERPRTTWKEHDGNVERYIRPFLIQKNWRAKRLGSFTAQDVEAIVNGARLKRARSNGSVANDGIPSLHVVKSIKKTLRMIFAEANRSGLLVRDPALGLRNTWKPEPISSHVPRADEMLAVARRLDAVRDVDRRGNPTGDAKEYLGHILRFAYFTGLRASELLGLRLEDVDHERSFIHVCRKVTVSGGRRHESTTMKTALSNRIVPLLPEATPSFWVLWHNARREPMSDYLCAGEPVLPRHRGSDGRWVTETSRRAIGYGTFQKHLKAAVDAAFDAGEIEAPFTLHDCRHAFATLLLSAGVEVSAVMEAMGHSSPKLTLGLYGSTRFERDFTDTAREMSRALRPVLIPDESYRGGFGADPDFDELGLPHWEEVLSDSGG